MALKSRDFAEAKPVAAVERALSLLQAFRYGDTELTLTELAKRAKLSKTTALRLAGTLERFGFLVRSINGGYRIGPRPLALAALYQHGTQEIEIILPGLQAIVARTEESAAYIVRLGGATMCLYQAPSPQGVRVHLVAGDVAPVERGAAGKIFLAFDDPPNPLLEQIRREKIAITYSEIRDAATDIAAPVFDSNGRLAGVVCASGPAFRFAGAAIERARSAMIDVARTLTVSLGGNPAMLAVEPANVVRPRKRSTA